MGAAIEIVEGPGKGWRYLLTVEDVRVGRGAGHQVKLDDPSWGAGYLRVQFRQGGYVVVNRMGHPILLDGDPLADGDEKTWFTGVCLQPTGGTLLRLGTADRPAGVEPAGGVIPLPPGVGAAAARKKRVNNWIAAGLVLAAVAGLAAKSALTSPPPTAADVLHVRLRPALVEAFPDGRGVELVTTLRKGLVYRSKGDTSSARRSCQEARQLIAQLASPKLAARAEDARRAALGFVAEREIDLDLD